MINDCAGQQIVDGLCEIAPSALLQRYERRKVTDGRRRYEGQDLDLLLADLSLEP